MIRAGVTLLIRLLCGCQARHLSAPSRSGPRIYFANHTSNLDAIVVWASLPEPCRSNCRIVAAEDYWGRGPVRRWLACRVFRALLIERKRVTRTNNPLTAINACLDEGRSIVIFPEGGRFLDDEPAPFKSGLWRLAKHKPGVELVPVWIENLSRVLPKGEVLPVPILVAVTYGEPLSTEPGETRQSFLDRARAALLALKDSTT